MKRFVIYQMLQAKENNPSFAGKIEELWYGRSGVTQTGRSVNENDKVEELAREYGYATEKTAQKYLDKYKAIFLYDDRLYWHTLELCVIPVDVSQNPKQ